VSPAAWRSRCPARCCRGAGASGLCDGRAPPLGLSAAHVAFVGEDAQRLLRLVCAVAGSGGVLGARWCLGGVVVVAWLGGVRGLLEGPGRTEDPRVMIHSPEGR
jgi:hypothetical protein